MSNSRAFRFTKDDIPLEQSTFLLPSPSDDSLASLWEVDSDIEQDNPSEISLRPARRRSDFLRDVDKDGENSRKPSKSIQPSPSEHSLAGSEEPDPLSRTHTAERDLEKKKSKKGFKLRKAKDDKDKHKEKKGKKEKEKKEKKPKEPLGQTLRRKLSLNPCKDREKDKDKLRTKHGFSFSSDHINVYNEPIESDPRGRVRTSQHMTAEVKLHFWRDKYEGSGRVERFMKLIHKKRIRKLLKTVIDLQTASLGSLRNHTRRRRDYD
ncbi:hypothetical protein TWF281_009837 [Arthrobotrys megalospora]